MGFDTEIIESIEFDDPSAELDDDDYDILLRELEALFSTGKGEYPIPGVKIKWKKCSTPVPVMTGDIVINELLQELGTVVVKNDARIKDVNGVSDRRVSDLPCYAKITNDYGLFFSDWMPDHCVFDGINQILMMDRDGANDAVIPESLIHFPKDDPVYIARELESMSFGEHFVVCIPNLNDLQISYLSSAFDATYSISRVLMQKLDINLTVFISNKLEFDTTLAVMRAVARRWRHQMEC
jgi:hypothetical protein|nr:MAG TPA: hypothetical protein [Caudoviricetes sp.]